MNSIELLEAEKKILESKSDRVFFRRPIIGSPSHPLIWSLDKEMAVRELKYLNIMKVMTTDHTTLIEYELW